MSNVQTVSTARPAQPSDSHPAARVGVLAFAVFMASLDLFIVNLAFPYIARSFPGTSIGSLSWVLNAYTIVFAATLIPAGRWADRIGRRRMLLAGLITFSAGSLACGLAPGAGGLVAARVVQAAGGGAMVPASLSLLLAIVPASGRARAIGAWSGLGALGAALGPVVGGPLVQAGWRWVFLINVPVGVVAIVLARRTLPESRDERAGDRPDLLGAVLLAVCVGLVALTLVEGPDWGWGSPRFIAGLVAALICGTATIVRANQHRAPAIELDLFRARTFRGAFAGSLLYYAGFSALVLNGVEFLTGVWHYSAVSAGLALAPGPLIVLPVAVLVTPRLIVRLSGPGRVALLGCAAQAAAAGLWLILMQAEPAYVTRFLPGQLVGGVGVGLTIPALLACGSASVPAPRFGAGSGLLNVARQLGTVLGVSGVIAILAHIDRLDPVATFRESTLLVTSFVVAAGVVCALLLVWRPRLAPAAEPSAGVAATAEAT